MKPDAAVHYMFYVPLMIINCSDWENKKRRLNDMSSFLVTDPNTKMATDYFENAETQRFLNNEKLMDLFKEEIQLFKNNFKFVDLQITSSWFQETKKESSHGYHTHHALGYSAVCYINFDENEHTPTNFFAPFFNFVDGAPLAYSVPNPKEGMLIFFPSCIPHQTQPNFSAKPRKIVSFNMTVKVE